MAHREEADLREMLMGEIEGKFMRRRVHTTGSESFAFMRTGNSSVSRIMLRGDQIQLLGYNDV